MATTEEIINALDAEDIPSITSNNLAMAIDKVVYKFNKLLMLMQQLGSSNAAIAYQNEKTKVEMVLQAIGRYFNKARSQAKSSSDTFSDLSMWVKHLGTKIDQFFKNQPKYVAVESYNYLHNGLGLRISNITAGRKKALEELKNQLAS